MAEKNYNTGMNYGQNRYPTGGPGGSFPYGHPPQRTAAPAPHTVGNKKSKHKRMSDEERARRRDQAKTLRARQSYALENIEYRRRVEAVQGKRGLDNSLYVLPVDKAPKKQKDYFFVMRKLVCFLMVLLFLVSAAVFALSFVSIAALPDEYTALFIEAPLKPSGTVPEEDEGEAENAAPVLNAEGDEEEEPVEDEDEVTTAPNVTYSVIDPIFGFIRHISTLVGFELNLGESPLYDAMLAKTEVGMTDTIAPIVMEYFPVALIIYVIIAVIMLFKAFFGMFGKRIYKGFFIGSLLMLICGIFTAFSGLAFMTELDAAINFKGIIDILIGSFTVGGFTAGYGLLALIVLPLVTLILSLFAKKKIPYSIFDR